MWGKRKEKNNTFSPNVCIIGAGMSGLCAAIQLKKKLEITSFTIFDVNEDVGGTWLVNKYPGCACDIHSHNYSYSFELNPDWSESCSSSDEIHKYVRKVAEKYDLYPSIKFRHQIKTLVWDEVIRKWKVTIANLDDEKNVPETHIFDIVINGPGALRAPRYPEEFMSFKGPIIHSAEWDPSVQLENKVVAVVGTGASAVQIIPAIADKVKELHVYQRTATWVVPRGQFRFSNLRKFLFAYVPFLMLMYRWFLFCMWEMLYLMCVGNSYFNRKAQRDTVQFMKTQIGDNEQLIKDLTPDYPWACKRLGVSSG